MKKRKKEEEETGQKYNVCVLRKAAIMITYKLQLYRRSVLIRMWFFVFHEL